MLSKLTNFCEGDGSIRNTQREEKESDARKGRRYDDDLFVKAIKVLVPFSSIHLCECRFPALTIIKRKYCSGLKVGDHLHLLLTAVHPRVSHDCTLKT